MSSPDGASVPDGPSATSSPGAADHVDAASARGISRRVQSDVYRAGISGATPRVPVRPDRLVRAARKALSAEAFAYLAGGAGSERTQTANRAAFDRWQVWPRPLRVV